MRTLQRLILLLIVCGFAAGATAQTAQDLKTVLERAQNYVAAYEEQLGTVIGEEDYLQEAVWDNTPPGGLKVGSERRRLSSDFLLVRVGDTWFGVRNVLRVNLAPADGRRADFGGILAQSPASIVQQLNAVNRSNTRYNIGDFLRTFNVPTFPLTILRRSNFGRFRFEKRSEKKLDNAMTWEIGFYEVAHPALIGDSHGKDQIERGRLWIDPDTGKVLKTETLIDGKTETVTYRASGRPEGGHIEVRSVATYKVSFVVTYKPSSKLNMLVPGTMQENYDADFHHVEGTATYSNFRRFETDVKLDIGPILQ